MRDANVGLRYWFHFAHGKILKAIEPFRQQRREKPGHVLRDENWQWKIRGQRREKSFERSRAAGRDADNKHAGHGELQRDSDTRLDRWNDRLPGRKFDKGPSGSRGKQRP